MNALCVPVCHSSAECATGQVCEEGICLAPACGSDSACGTGQVCSSGACTTAPATSQVASCTVTPNPAVVHAGATVQLTVLAFDASGNVLHFPNSSNFTWAVTGSAGTVNAGTGLVTGTSAGDIPVTATVAGTAKTCTATVKGYAAVAAGSLRVTVINIHTKEPVVGAKVVLGASPTAVSTGADGTATFANQTGTTDVHVFARGYGYTSYIQTSAKDLLVPLTPFVASSQRSGFTGHVCETRASDPTGKCTSTGEFAPLQDQGESVHLAFFGSAIPNSLLDLSVSTLVGPTHIVHLNIANNKADAPLPYGLTLGVGSSFFGTEDYRVYAEQGVRSLWGLGGNVNLTKVISVLGPALQGGGANIDIGKLLPQLLTFFGRFQAGAVVGVQAPADVAAGGSPAFTAKNIALTTPLRLKIPAISANLPKLDDTYVDGVLAVAGAMDYPMGFVPLGITAGISAKDGTGKVLDPTCDASGGIAPCATNKLPLKLASENGGTEGSPIGVALLAVNFGGLTPGSTQRIAVSGVIKVLDKVDYVAPPGEGPTQTFPAFIALHKTAAVSATKTSRQLNFNGDPDPNNQIYRFEVTNNARLTWNVWMNPANSPSASQLVTLPDPSLIDPALVDPFQPANNDLGVSGAASARLLALQLITPAGTTKKTAADLETFGSLTLDAIGANLAAFTVLQVPIQ